MQKRKFVSGAAMLGALMGGLLSSQAATFAPATPQGTITANEYESITGTTIPDLTNNVKYPFMPDVVAYPTLFEWPSNEDGTAPGSDIKNDYGVMMQGWVYPPTTTD